MAKKKRAAKSKAPIDCTFEELCEIKRDNFDVGEFWAMTDSCEVTLARQKSGESPTEKISIPVSIFKRLLRGLQTPQELKKGGWLDG